jgi:hypothetical protein
VEIRLYWKRMNFLFDIWSADRKKDRISHPAGLRSRSSQQVWEGEEFLEAHAKAPHVQSFRIEAPQLLEGPVLTTRWKVVE